MDRLRKSLAPHPWDFGSKVSNFHYFYIIFSFVVILMKHFEIYIMNRYYRLTEGKLRNFFRNFPFIFSCKKTMFFAGKYDFSIFHFGKP